ncbi:MAG: HAD-IIB family hydrolase, partial [Chloroflexota bacterium]
LRHQQTLDTDIVRQVVTFAEDRGFAVALYAQGRIIARSKTPYINELHDKWGDTQPEYVGPLQNILSSTQVNKLVAMSAYDDRKTKALRWQLNAQINGKARLMNGGVGHQVEVLPPGASKGTALKSLLREMKIDPKNVMAIGDAENDVEMVRLAGVGVAVGNAQQMLKDAADVITVTNDEDGVAQIIEKYVTQTVMEAAAPVDSAVPPQAEAVAPEAPEKAEPAAPKPENITPESSEE